MIENIKSSFSFSANEAAGSDGDFMEVTHLKLKGSNFEIGKLLGQISKEKYGVVKIPWTNAEKVNAQRRFIKNNYPIHYERMRGAAEAFGMELEKENIEFSGLYYYMGVPGCTAVYYPPSCTVCGNGLLSRNFDFTTGTVRGMPPADNEKAAVSRPYIIEVYPDKGFSSLYLCSFDLLGGTLDGINSEGLAVTILADEESALFCQTEPVLGSGVGIHELLMPRMILDMCSNVQEAKELLLQMKQFYFFAPLHYLIADRFGNSFVWERSYTGNQEFIIEGNHKPQVVTNFLLHHHEKRERLPETDRTSGRIFARHKIVSEEIEKSISPFSMEEIKGINSLVFWEEGTWSDKEAVPRTLWHSIYNTDERSMEVSFFLRDKLDQGSIKKSLRSDYIKFNLEY